ncbi:DUF4396 domain-containing protein [Hydrogenovibrio marinus]|uniref:DUF4396 domain-containing protein n=1 Tax=Hydrogenovibrio marinus TaxID=28885 RepID=A0A066ZSR3_HYDMR|nr:DUF4396 domain-containing protein [Hydrogenovibrio marinus]KDN95304.1 hypothetical protein EI16_03100 [Hydrogenovibrio marinus]BBN59786.1 hypothetical protein HVMH_1380 [Hydrogenovibrio marinus]
MNTVWNNKINWIKSAHNTKWCLIGCAIGDFGTIAYFQFNEHSLSTFSVMMLATLNGLLTSILLETLILFRSNFSLKDALITALGMSFISMLAMEIAMNITDYLLTGGAVLNWWVIPISLFIGFLTPWPYNYWRLQKHGKSCH